MTVPTTDLVDPAVRAFVEAVNAHDRGALAAAMTDQASMTDDGRAREPGPWLDGEVFDTDGRMEVASQSDDGRDLVVRFTNSRWGTMRTTWHFESEQGKVSHFDTGQA
jgi:hypothetical protein